MELESPKSFMANVFKIDPPRTNTYSIPILIRVPEYELIDRASNLAALWIW